MHARKEICSRLALAGICSMALLQVSYGAVFFTETFDSGLDNWYSRDPGKMIVTPGYPGGGLSGAAKGSFAAQVFPNLQTDAWRADGTSSGGEFTGNYWLDHPGFTGLSFDFYSANILPQDLSFRFSDGTRTYSIALLPLNLQVNTTGVWSQVRVSLDYSSGWLGGGNATQFSNALSHVTWVDVQVTREGQGAQDYYIDNFGFLSGLIFIPEPASGLFWFGWVLVFGGLRRRIIGRRDRSPYALRTASRR